MVEPESSTSVFADAIEEPTSPMTLHDYEMVSLWNSTKAEGQQQQPPQPQPQQQSPQRPPPESLAGAADSSSSKSSDDSITYLEQDTPFATVKERAGEAVGETSSNQRSPTAPYTSEREASFRSMRESPSAAVASPPPHVSVMSRSAIAPSTSSPAMPQALRSPIASPTPTQVDSQSQPAKGDKSAGGC